MVTKGLRLFAIIVFTTVIGFSLGCDDEEEELSDCCFCKCGERGVAGCDPDERPSLHEEINSSKKDMDCESECNKRCTPCRTRYEEC